VDIRQAATSQRLGDETVIERGVEPGDTVVTEGTLRLVPGARVSVRTRGGPAGGRGNREAGSGPRAGAGETAEAAGSPAAGPGPAGGFRSGAGAATPGASGLRKTEAGGVPGSGKTGRPEGGWRGRQP
jgi:membrane fusion protein, multidrug efflux system